MMEGQPPLGLVSEAPSHPDAVVDGAVATQDAQVPAANSGAAHAAAPTAGAPNPLPASPDTSRDSSVAGNPTVTLDFDFGRYVGEVDPTNGLRCGKGTLTYNSGNVYDGEWRDGAANGIGEKRYANGDVYRGCWVDGKRSGRGGYLYARGDYFEGMYADDEPNGYGVLQTVNGDRYAGHWKDGKKDGKGRETLHDGRLFIGHWKAGHKQGRGKLFVPGAKGFVFGVWNDDRFFRELTQEEMGMDGEVDIVDRYGLPTDPSDPFSAAAIATRAGLPPPPPPLFPPAAAAAFGQPSPAGGVGSAITDAFLFGVSAIEGRLEALGRALEKVTTGAEGQPPGPRQPTSPFGTAANGGTRPEATAEPSASGADTAPLLRTDLAREDYPRD